eukprot:3386212-Amphidinium_carterae.1
MLPSGNVWSESTRAHPFKRVGVNKSAVWGAPMKPEQAPPVTTPDDPSSTRPINTRTVTNANLKELATHR